MPSLRCTVRGCTGALAREGSTLRCAGGHAFDRAREGYWNLLQPQDRRSPEAGDRPAAIEARRRWLARGFADGLVQSISSAIDRLSLPPGASAVDVGCGEGTMTVLLLGSRDLDGCGVDLAPHAIRLASKAAPALTFIVANADRGLPFADGSVRLALSIFGRRPVDELRRILDDRGTLLVVLPAEDDLLELREASQGEALRRDRTGDALAELCSRFELRARSDWRQRARHDRDAWEDALAMSYRGARASERLRLSSLAGLDLTLAAEILELVPRPGLR